MARFPRFFLGAHMQSPRKWLPRLMKRAVESFCTAPGPGGSGHLVRISGWEAWRLSDAVLVSESLGRFDAVEYERQLAEGIDHE